MRLADVEREKYERVWKIPAYGNFSPGERMVDAFIEVVQPDEDAAITDFGTGSGKAARKLQKLGFHVNTVDHTATGISKHRWQYLRSGFTQACLWDMGNVGFTQYGYCVDVMEHIPMEATMLTIREIMFHCDYCFFQISTRPDVFGREIGEPLHLTVMPYGWWLERLKDLCEVFDARDLMHSGMFYVGN